jgi:Domain of unknown function (DUF4145)
MTYIPPKALAKSFTCPNCAVVALQSWWHASFDGQHYGDLKHEQLRIGKFHHCNKHSLWVVDSMVFPSSGMSPPINPFMPSKVAELYREAGEIFSRSPRAAAALLRLGIQVLCNELGEKGKNINDDIASLVFKGLPVIVQQSLDLVRVTGNDAVHPGQIDTDNPEVVANLFGLTNVIVEYMIALPNKVSGLYKNLPAQKLAEIEKRDSKDGE